MSRTARLLLAASGLLLCLTASPFTSADPGGRPSAEPGATSGPATQRAGELAHLQLFPLTGAKAGAPDPAALKALADSQWVWGGPRNILGVGVETIFRFHADEDRNLTLERTSRRYRSVNDKGERFVDQKESFVAEVKGPFLRYGALRQTFVVVPGKALVLNALVPTGEGRWYAAVRREGAKGEPFDDEMLLEFADDPMKKDEGAGTFRLTLSRGGNVLKEQVRFVLERSDAQGRTFRLESSDGRTRARQAQVHFPPDGAYGLVLDEPLMRSQVFTAGPAEK